MEASMESGSKSALTHVLAVDDDPSVRELISTYLEDHDVRVTAVGTERDMLAVISRDRVSLVLLDLKLKGEDGMRIARDLRETSRLPIIILTGRLDEADRVMCLELGADDYLTKPFSPRELLARIRALLRRARMYETLADTVASIRAYRFAGWELGLGLRRLTAPDGAVIPLRNAEFNLLLAFLSSPRKVLSRDKLLDMSRLHNAEVYDRAVDAQVSRLRRKLEFGSAAMQLITTERNSGYIFTSDVEVVRN